MTNVPMMFVKNSGALVPEIIVNSTGYGMNAARYFQSQTHNSIVTQFTLNSPAAMKVAPATSSDNFNVSHIISKTGTK